MFSKNFISFSLLVMILTAQLAFGQSHDIRIHQSNGEVMRKTVTEIDSITFQETSTVTDIDGNVYKTVKIGDQWWTTENLKVTHYSDGTPIPLVTDNSSWAGLSTGAYCAYNNDASNESDTYGYMYNWYAVNGNGGTYSLAPSGWHVPTDAEWTTLTTFLDGENAAGGKLKEAGTTYWNSPNTGATNESGFAALPGGYRDYDGYFGGLGGYAFFWSSTEIYGGNAWGRDLRYDYSEVIRGNFDKQSGFSVRCVKD